MTSKAHTDPATEPVQRAAPHLNHVDGLDNPWTWLPILAFPILILLLWTISNQTRYEPPFLLPILNGLFVTLASILIALLAARTWLAGGSGGLLAMGAGMLIISLVSIASPVALQRGRIDDAVSIYGLGFCLAGLTHVVGVLLLLSPPRTAARPLRWTVLLASYVLATMVVLGIIRFVGQLPPFVVPGQSSTAIRKLVMGSAILQFAGVALLMLVRSRETRSPFLSWYGRGLLLIAVGLLGVTSTPVIGSVVTWSGRSAQYAGGLYLLVAAMIARRQGRTWTIPLKQLWETHDRYSRLVEFCPDPILVHADGRWLFANPAAAKLFGAVSPRDLIGREVLSMVHPDDRGAVEQRIERASSGPTPLRQVTMIRLDGGVVPVEVTGVGVDYEGQPAVQVVIRDISQRKQAEESLHQSRQRLSLALDAIGASQSYWDVRTGKLEWNARAYELLGYTPGSFAPDYDKWRSRLHPEDRDRIEAEVQACMDEHRDFFGEYRVLWPDGSCHWLRAARRFDYDAAGQPTYCTSVLYDITDLKNIEAELRRAKDAAEGANKAKDHFLAVLSHELRTPLNPALMAATILEQSPQLPPDLRDDIAIIRRNVELEARLIDDLLDLTRITRGKLTLAWRIIDGCQVLRHAVETCQAEAVDKEQVLDVKLPEAPVNVYVDPARLQQVFWNLLKNAIKFTPDHGRITVHAAATEHGGLRVEISDTGKGIEPAALPSIFDAFEQGGLNITKRYGGLGLGLAICKGLVGMHNGSIHASSDGPGKGSTFVVELPAPPSELEEPAPGSRGTAAAHASPASSGCHILLVEDHESTAVMTARLLRSFGHSVTTADRMQCALEKFAKGSFDLVISDLGLPDGSGQELIRQLLLQRPVKAIALSGYGMETDVQQSIQAGFLEHLVKPINVRQLQDAVARILGDDCRSNRV